MVRPVVKNYNERGEMEIKKLAVSSSMKESLRAPTIWEKPASAMYDYHNQISGLYYQPMIKYCIGREKGQERSVVDMPDRLQSNYDKRSYKLKNTNQDYEKFLVQLYQKRMKANHTKFSHCANEMARMSKSSTELGVVKDSGSMRDKYLTQLQLMYTEKLAKKGCIKGGVVEKISEKYVEDDDTKVDVAEKKEMNHMLARKRNDKRYGPCYERVTVLDSERYQMGDEVDFLQGCYNAERVRRQEEEAKVEAEQEESVRIVRQVNGQTVEDSTESKRKSFVNPGYLDADTMLAFLAVTDEEKLAAADTTERTLPFIYRDTTHSRALLDVKDRVKIAGKKMLPHKPVMGDMNFNYHSKKVEKIGEHEKAYVRATMFKKPALPDFDVGYDIV